MPQAVVVAIPFILEAVTVVVTVYSAVSAVKALKDGNIMGAVVAGFGAYMGASSLMSTSTTSATASVGSEGLGAAESGNFLNTVGGNSDVLSAKDLGFSSISSEAPALSQSANLLTPNAGSTLDLAGVAADAGTTVGGSSGGFLSSLGDTFSDMGNSVANNIRDLGGDVTGLQSLGDGTFQNAVGDIFNSGGELIKSYGEPVMKGVGAYMQYKGQQEQRADLKEAADTSRAFGEKRANDYRARTGAAPTFVPKGAL